LFYPHHCFVVVEFRLNLIMQMIVGCYLKDYFVVVGLVRLVKKLLALLTKNVRYKIIRHGNFLVYVCCGGIH